MALGVVILARLDSRRLPGKALLDVAGAPLVQRVIRRVAAVGPTVLATSDRPVDDPLAAAGAAAGAQVFRGSCDDVLGRTLACAQACGFDRIVRVCGDSPFIDPVLMAELAERHRQGGADIVTNVCPRSYPPGNSIEVVSTAALERAAAATVLPEDREHVTRFIYGHPEQFSIENHTAADAAAYAGLTLTVDLPEDLEKTRWIAARLEDPAAAPFAQVISLARQWETGR